jgi:hypothetical protein
MVTISYFHWSGVLLAATSIQPVTTKSPVASFRIDTKFLKKIAQADRDALLRVGAGPGPWSYQIRSQLPFATASLHICTLRDACPGPSPGDSGISVLAFGRRKVPELLRIPQKIPFVGSRRPDENRWVSISFSRTLLNPAA